MPSGVLFPLPFEEAAAPEDTEIDYSQDDPSRRLIDANEAKFRHRGLGTLKSVCTAAGFNAKHLLLLYTNLFKLVDYAVFKKIKKAHGQHYSQKYV